MNPNLGDLLVMAGLLSDKQLETALGYQQSVGGELAEIVVKLGFVDDKKLTEFLAMQEELTVADVENMVIPVELVKSIPRDLILKRHVLPVRATTDVITLAMSDPTDYASIEEVQFVTGKRVEVNLASRESLHKVIQQFYDVLDGQSADPLISQLASEQDVKSVKGGQAAGTGSQNRLPKITARKRFESLLPALIPVLIRKKIVTEEELKQMLDKLNKPGSGQQ